MLFFGLRVKLPPAQCLPVYRTRWRLVTVRFNAKRKQEAVNTTFYSVWFAPHEIQQKVTVSVADLLSTRTLLSKCSNLKH